MRVVIPHRVMREDQRNLSRPRNAHRRAAHEERMMGVYDVWPKCVHLCRYQPRRRHWERKLTPIEMLDGWHPNDVWIIRLIAITIDFGGNHQNFMPPPAIFLLECHNAARNAAHHRRIRVG